MLNFKNTHFTIPRTLKPNDNYLIEFEFVGDEKEISKISPSCGCTANCRHTSNKVLADFTENAARDLKPDSYPDGIFNFSKTINVFTKDKQVHKLTFDGKVKI